MVSLWLMTYVTMEFVYKANAGSHIVNLCEDPLKASWGDDVNPIWNLRLLERDGQKQLKLLGRAMCLNTSVETELLFVTKCTIDS